MDEGRTGRAGGSRIPQGRGFLEAACFHAQQAVEKSLKARLLGKGWELEKVHSIARLLALSNDYKIPSNLGDEEIQFMDSIYRGRDADRALTIAVKALHPEKQ